MTPERRVKIIKSISETLGARFLELNNDSQRQEFADSLRSEAEKLAEAEIREYVTISDRVSIVSEVVSQVKRQCLVHQVIRITRETVNYAGMQDEEFRREVEKILDREKREYMLASVRSELVNEVCASFRGFGPLESLLKDDDVTEIMVNGPHEIFIERKGKLSQLERAFESEEQLKLVIERITQEAKREVNQGSPILDTRLQDGSRVSIVMPPISLKGPTLTIRKFSKDPMTVEKLISYGSITPEIARFLEKLVKARYNIFISGGTGSGKTTFLNAVSNFIPKDERVITIEDSAELNIEGVANLVRLETRNATAAAQDAEVTIQDLIKASLRMRPDRIIVGEVRGKEALDMLQAMNTGHDGSLSTGHANSAQDMMSRLETMVLQGSESLPLMSIRRQIVSAVDIIIHLGRLRDHSRKTLLIAEVVRLDENGEIVLNPLYRFEEDPELTSLNKVVGRLKRTENPMIQVEKLQMAGMTADI